MQSLQNLTQTISDCLKVDVCSDFTRSIKRMHTQMVLLEKKMSVCIRDLQSFEIRIRIGRSIRFDWRIRKFSNRIGRTCSFARRKLSQMTQTINGV